MSIEPYKPRAGLPLLFGDVPTFLGLPKARPSSSSIHEPESQDDVIIFGAPWEGALTWGSYAGCAHAPDTIRRCSLRYGSWLPEYDVDFLDRLRVTDMGNVAVDPADQASSLEGISAATRHIGAAGARPVALGGDHSISIPVVSALRDRYHKIGVIVFDAHFDNAPDYEGNQFARCAVFSRLAEMPHVASENIVHVGIRGPRNGRSQARAASAMGATVLSAIDIERLGIMDVTRRAIEAASDGVDGVYLSLDTDVLDSAYNPGGPVEYGGMRARDLFDSVFTIASHGIIGADIVEVYPPQDPADHSSHLCAQLLIHMLCGMASSKAT